MKATTGRIRDADLDEVKKRSDLIEVASEYMQLRRAGRLYKGLCPFHQEKTPSFSIDPAKGLYFCFGCQEGGDVITLVSKIESLTFSESIERLARRAGVELQYEKLTPGEKSAKRKRMRLIDAHRAATEIYHELLLTDDRAADARRYLAGRGFAREIAGRYSIGFAPPGWETLVTALRERGFKPSELTDAGLASTTQDGRLIDRFRNRIMFPIFEVTGDPVAFGARQMPGDDDGPKYLNSSESPIYHKSKVLYGLNWAKSPIVKAGRVLIVEGYTDVIAVQAAGVEEAVATCGTALGADHLRALQRFTQRVILSLDADEAGGKAAERMYDQLIGDAQELGLTTQVLLMPRGTDPADAIAAEGAEAFAERVENAVPLVEFVLKREAERYRVGDPEVRARALAAGLRLLSKTDHEVVRMEYARRLSDWIKVDPNIIHVELEKIMTTGTTPRATTDVVIKRSSTQVRLEREALKLALQHPGLVTEHTATVDGSFSVPSYRELWHVIASGAEPNVDELSDEARRAYTELSVQPVDGEPTERLVAEVFTRLKEFVLSRQIDDLKGKLQQINPVDDPQGHTAMFSELIELERSKRALTEEQ